jgi:uncharacterized Zn-binding protein involved in type VI secretion
MPPAARITDMHVCPMVTVLVPHVGGPILPPCEPTVLIGYLPAARITDMLTCVGPPDMIMMGSPTVLIGGLMAARIGDPTVHGGVIVLGCFTVIIGEAGAPSPSAPSAPASPAPAAPAAGGAGASDQATLDKIKALLKKCTTGKEAVKYLEDQKIPVEFANGNGSYWDGKKIVVSRSESVNSAALTMVHELHHARSSKDGTSGNTKSDKRDSYVNKMVEEESVGTVKSIQAKNELVAGGEKISETFPLESQYNESHAKAAEAYKKANPDAKPEDIEAAGQKAGLDAVRKGFNDGSVVTSNTNEKYPDYYGKSWDKANP